MVQDSQNINVLIDDLQHNCKNEAWTSILQNHQIHPDSQVPPFPGDIFPDDQDPNNVGPNVEFLNVDFMHSYLCNSGGGHVEWSEINDLDVDPE